MHHAGEDSCTLVCPDTVVIQPELGPRVYSLEYKESAKFLNWRYAKVAGRQE